MACRAVSGFYFPEIKKFKLGGAKMKTVYPDPARDGDPELRIAAFRMPQKCRVEFEIDYNSTADSNLLTCYK